MKTVFLSTMIILLSAPAMGGNLTLGKSSIVNTEIDRVQAGIRIESVKRLIYTSSAALRVQDSGQPEVRAGYATLQERYQEAVAKFEDDSYGAAYDILTEVTRNMFQTVRQTDAGELFESKHQRDFRDRKSSVDALLAAHDRISQEKQNTKAHDELRVLVGNHVAEAETLTGQAQFVAGRVELDTAYVLIKVSIEHLRGGDTLIHSLEFATPEDEYYYELDRNDTHRMLMTMLTDEKLESNPAMRKMVEGYLLHAEAMRGEAQQLAAKGDYNNAIQHLESSTSQVVRAIRGAGIYIPGA